jgi:hypothetical protein
MGLKPVGNSSGPYLTAVGKGCGVGETAGVEVGTTSVTVAVATGFVLLVGVVAGVLFEQEEKVKSERTKSNKYSLCKLCFIIRGKETSGQKMARSTLYRMPRKDLRRARSIIL